MNNVIRKQLLYEKIESDKEELFALLGSLIQINSENFGSYGNEKGLDTHGDLQCRRNVSKPYRYYFFVKSGFKRTEITHP